LLAELRALRPEFERRGVTRMALFGSRARGDNRPDSDVDLVVNIEPGRKFSMLDAIGLGHIVQDRLGLETNVTVIDKYADPKFTRNVEQDRALVFR
jgi:hypothetical protein